MTDNVCSVSPQTFFQITPLNFCCYKFEDCSSRYSVVMNNITSRRARDNTTVFIRRPLAFFAN